ncbi:MAG: prepilin-type N-terminal cleavage/methylation domain-containing protein [Deltaproteobacteria bacterium]|nr:prepilin-type N-terminal cleavage/methylation domain-containing protein [Deltaproteobacteria bacterium]
MKAGPISDNDPKVLFFMHKGNRRGVTLLELIVVLIIISLMSAVVVPRLAGPMGNLDLKTASQKISASLRYVRSNAASGKTTYVALFDFDQNRLILANAANSPLDREDFQISNRASFDRAPADPPDSEKEQPGDVKTYTLPDGVKLAKGVSREGDFNSGLFRIFFYPSGGSSGGEITVANERGRQYKINVDFITGTVQLLEVTG